MTIANVTATKDGDTLEDSAEIDGADLAALLDFADEIVIHDIHDREWVDDRKRRYPDEWDAKVTVESGNDAPEPDMGESGECLHVDCTDHADFAVICDTGTVKHYCEQHAAPVGRRAGHNRVEERVEL